MIFFIEFEKDNQCPTMDFEIIWRNLCPTNEYIHCNMLFFAETLDIECCSLAKLLYICKAIQMDCRDI